MCMEKSMCDTQEHISSFVDNKTNKPAGRFFAGDGAGSSAGASSSSPVEFNIEFDYP